MVESVKFDGEESGSDNAAPHLDLIAAGFLICLALIVMIASLKLPVPGAILTAPGLLPFLTAASLLCMALLLAATAIKRRRDITTLFSVTGDKAEHVRTLLLIAIVGTYIAALQQLAFSQSFALGNLFFNISAFEPVTIIMLALVIQVAWRGPFWVTTLLAIVWTMLLSVVFQQAFEIPLPGSF